MIFLLIQRKKKKGSFIQIQDIEKRKGIISWDVKLSGKQCHMQNPLQ